MERNIYSHKLSTYYKALVKFTRGIILILIVVVIVILIIILILIIYFSNLFF